MAVTHFVARAPAPLVEDLVEVFGQETVVSVVICLVSVNVERGFVALYYVADKVVHAGHATHWIADLIECIYNYFGRHLIKHCDEFLVQTALVHVCIEVHKLFQLNLDLFELLLSPC